MTRLVWRLLVKPFPLSKMLRSSEARVVHHTLLSLATGRWRTRQLRKRLDWSQTDLAEKAGIHPNTAARIERGEFEPSLSMADALASALGCRIEDLLGGKGKR